MVKKEIINFNYKNLKIFEGKYKPINLNSFDLSKKYLMFCGIGNPHEFERTLNRYRFNIKEKKIYPDHFKIPSIEIKKLKDSAKNKGYILITTEKDYFRLNKIERKNIKFLKTKLEIKNIKSFTKILLLRL